MSKVSRVLGPEAPPPSKASQQPPPRPNPRSSYVRPNSTSYRDVDAEKASISSRRSGRSERVSAQKSNLTFLFSDSPSTRPNSIHQQDPAHAAAETTEGQVQQGSRRGSAQADGNDDMKSRHTKAVVEDSQEPPVEVFPSAPQRKTSKLSLSRLFSRSKRRERPTAPPSAYKKQPQTSTDAPSRKKSNKLKKNASKDSLNSDKANKEVQDAVSHAVSMPPLPPQVDRIRAREASPRRSTSRMSSRQAVDDTRVSFDVPPGSSAGSVRSMRTDTTNNAVPQSRASRTAPTEHRQSTMSNATAGKSKHMRFAANAPFKGQSILELSDSEDDRTDGADQPGNRNSTISNRSGLSGASSGNKRQKAAHHPQAESPAALQTSFGDVSSDMPPQSPMLAQSPRMTHSRTSWVSNASTVKQGRSGSALDRAQVISRENAESRWMAVTPEEAAILAIIRRERGTDSAPQIGRPPSASAQRARPVPNRNAFAQQTALRDSSGSDEYQMPPSYPIPPRPGTAQSRTAIKDTPTARTKVTDIYVPAAAAGAWPTPSPSTENDDTGSPETDAKADSDQDAASDLPKMPSSFATKAPRHSRLPVALQPTWLGSPAESGANSPSAPRGDHPQTHPQTHSHTPVQIQAEPPVTRNFSKPVQRYGNVRVNRDALVAKKIETYERNLR